jgi:hypothetical protein
MKNLQQDEPHMLLEKSNMTKAKLPRRSFLQYSGAGVASLALIAAGCKKNNNFPDDGNGNGGTVDESGINLGSGDLGILNYAYVLEQLEAAFYAKVVASPYSSPAQEHEMEFLKDIAAHEVAHRELLKKALGTNAVHEIVVDFSSIDFTKRDTVLATAKAFEDLGVSAYNGAGKLLKDSANLALAAKVVSVEARHSAYLRELISMNSFANTEVVLDPNAFEKSRTPAEVLVIAQKYIKNPITASNLPTS